MKIVHAGHVPIPADLREKYHAEVSHPGRWVLNHAIAQRAAGMDVEIVTQARKSAEDFTAEIEGVRVHFLRTFHPYRHLTFYAIDSVRMARYLRKLSPDIVHAHGTENVYALAAIRSKLPFCVTAQGLFFQILPTLPPGVHLNERFIRVSEHWAWKRTKDAVAKSEYVRDALAKEYPHLDITLIPNTYQPELDSELGVARALHDLAFVGSMDYRKGIDLIYEALKIVAAKFPDVRMHLVGNAPEGHGGEYEQAQVSSMRRALGENLILHGKRKSTELFKVLDGCACLLAPSREEMFGNQLIEGLMRGCHGIVAENTALAENVRRFGNGTIVPQNNADALASAICAVLSSPPSAATAEQARQRIRAYMSPTVVAGKHRELYERIVAY